MSSAVDSAATTPRDDSCGESNLGAFALRTKADGRSVDVAITVGFLTYENPRRLSELQILVEAANSGEKTVQLQSLSILLPNDQQLLFFPPTGTVSLPTKLEEGQNCSFWSDASEIAARLKQNGFKGKVTLTACFRDSLGNRFMSRPRPFNVDSPG